MINLIALTILILSTTIPLAWLGVLFTTKAVLDYRARVAYRRAVKRGLNPSPWSKR